MTHNILVDTDILIDIISLDLPSLTKNQSNYQFISEVITLCLIK